MLKIVILPVLMQLSDVPDNFYESEYSNAVEAIVAQRGEMDAAALVAALEALAVEGDDSAFEVLGEIHNAGAFGIARDSAKACDYFERVQSRRADTLHNLATCYYAGDGRAQDFAKARTFYLEAAEAGWRMSFCAYGNMLVRGEGGPVDAKEGVRLCRMTAIAGDPDAQTDYGGYLLMGEGVERDPVAARFMLEQAGAQEQRNAAFLLGQIHTRGDGTPVDHVQATEWFAKSYEWGRDDAAYEVARSYLRRGYTRNADGTATISRELLRQSLEWLETARAVNPAGSEERASAEELASAIEKMLASPARD